MNPDAVKAAAELADLHAQVAEARAVLIRVLQDTVEAEARLGSMEAAQLLEANEELVVAAMRNQREAESAAKALDVASRIGELDVLTQLPNRLLLLDRFAQAIANARRHVTRMAVLFIDLDDFKRINDTAGHAAGDQVLKQVAGVLVASVREADTVSRHGGDEFMVLLSEVTQVSDAVRIAEKVLAALAILVDVDGREAGVKASIGISVYPDDGDEVDVLIERADAAMYRAKCQGSGKVALHADSSDQPKPKRVEWEPDVGATLQAQMREANEHLVLTVLSAEELKQAAQAAQRRQTAFMAVVADELRNPMAPIRIATAMLGRVKADEPLLPRVQALIERQLTQMSQLLDDMLDVTRAGPRTSTFSLECSRVDLGEVVREVADSALALLTGRSQHLVLKLPETTLEVMGDRPRLGQIVGNLLDNASKYSTNGASIRITASRTEDAIGLTVADDGLGISAAALAGIFEPFAQDGHSIGFNGVGVGIGLTVVRHLVQVLGGTVVAHSDGSGLGSLFTVTLPRASGAATP